MRQVEEIEQTQMEWEDNNTTCRFHCLRQTWFQTLSQKEEKKTTCSQKTTPDTTAGGVKITKADNKINTKLGDLPHTDGR
jgi:hypothetical protein